MHFVEPVSREERLRRIAHILIMAGMLYRRAATAGQMPMPSELLEPIQPPTANPAPTDDRSRILQYIQRRGAAAPKDIRLALGLSRATTQRRLAELVRDRLISATGSTQSLVYQPLASIYSFAESSSVDSEAHRPPRELAS